MALWRYTNPLLSLLLLFIINLIQYYSGHYKKTEIDWLFEYHIITGATELVVLVYWRAEYGGLSSVSFGQPSIDPLPMFDGSFMSYKHNTSANYNGHNKNTLSQWQQS